MKNAFLTLIFCLGVVFDCRSQQWNLQKFTDSGITSSNAIARDEAGNLYITGFFSDTLNFNNQQYISQGACTRRSLISVEGARLRWSQIGQGDGKVLPRTFSTVQDPAAIVLNFGRASE